MDRRVDAAEERAPRAAVPVGVRPPTSRGTSRRWLAGSPGLTRSGAKARSKSRPATRPDAPAPGGTGPVVVPGKVVDWRTTSWPGRSVAGGRGSRPRSTAPRSGSLASLIGRRDADEDDVRGAELRLAGRDDTEARGRGRRAGGRRSTSSIGERPSRELLRRAAGVGVDADHVEAGLDERERQRQPDVAETDDRDARLSAAGVVARDAPLPWTSAASGAPDRAADRPRDPGRSSSGRPSISRRLAIRRSMRPRYGRDCSAQDSSRTRAARPRRRGPRAPAGRRRGAGSPSARPRASPGS